MRRPALVALLALAAGCNTNPPNPFERTNATVTPPPDAEVIVTSDAYAPAGGAPRDVFAVGSAGKLTRLTFCNESRACDNEEAASAPDRKRLAVRRTVDRDGDGRLTPADGSALMFVDLARNVEGTLAPAGAQVSGIDWSPRAEILVYSGLGLGGLEDLYRIDSNGQNVGNLTATSAVRERRPRIDPSGTIAAFERIDESAKGEVWIFVSGLDQRRVTSGGPGSEPLPDTPYVVGSDADPVFSPDGRSLAFRRLAGTGSSGLGAWDVMTVATDGSGLTAIVTGAAFRGAPDWGPSGIVFEEIDATGTSSLVVVQPDGSGRRAIASRAAGFRLSDPRWLVSPGAP